MTSKLKLMLVDDHAVVRGGFKVLLQTWNDVEVVAEASSGEEALQLYENCRPDVDRKNTRLNSSHSQQSRMPSSA